MQMFCSMWGFIRVALHSCRQKAFNVVAVEQPCSAYLLHNSRRRRFQHHHPASLGPSSSAIQRGRRLVDHGQFTHKLPRCLRARKQRGMATIDEREHIIHDIQLRWRYQCAAIRSDMSCVQPASRAHTAHIRLHTDKAVGKSEHVQEVYKHAFQNLSLARDLLLDAMNQHETIHNQMPRLGCCFFFFWSKYLFVYIATVF